MNDIIYKVLAEKQRRKIIVLLKAKDMTVGEIQKALNVGQPTVSSHLALLKKANLVDIKIDQNKRIYRLKTEELERFVKEWNKFMGHELFEDKAEIVVRRS